MSELASSFGVSLPKPAHGSLTCLGGRSRILQGFVLQDLVGPIPEFTRESATKMSELRLSNTSIQQCGASHLSVYKEGLKGTTVRAGPSSDMGTDNATGCLPQFLLFCDETSTDDVALFCPSVSFRRPAEVPITHIDKVSASLLPGMFYT